MSTETTLSHTETASLADGLSDHELTYQLIQLETRLDLRIGDVPAAQIIRAACRRIELKNRLLGSARELLEEWMLASDNFEMETWTLRVRNMLEGSNPFNTEQLPGRCEHGVLDDEHCEQCCNQCQEDIAEMLKSHVSDDEVTK
jgi:hypothetical protein